MIYVFPDDGTSAMGLKFKNCVFSTPDSVLGPSSATVIDENG